MQDFNISPANYKLTSSSSGNLEDFFTKYQALEPPPIAVTEGEMFPTDNTQTIPWSKEIQPPPIFNNEWQQPVDIKFKLDTPKENEVKFSLLTPQLQSYRGNKAKYIIQFFMNKGLTQEQARGIYGNIMQESGGNINAMSKDGHNSYGLAQWTGERKTRLFNRYGTKPTFEQQLNFLWEELNTTHKSALEALKKATTVADATKVFMDKFERPHKDYANFNNRLRYALQSIG